MASSSNPSPPPSAPPPPSHPPSSSSSWLSPFPSPLIPSPPPLPCANEEHKAGVPHELTSFRAREGKQARENKLRELWAGLPAKDPTSPPSSSSSSVSSTTSQPSSQPSSSTPSPPTPPNLSTPSSSSPLPPSAASSSSSPPPSPGLSSTLSPERAEALLSLYQQELVRRCTSEPSNPHAREFAGEGLGPWDREQGEPKKEKVVDWKQFRTYLWEKEAELWNAFHAMDQNHDGRLDVGDMSAALSKADITLTHQTLHDFVSFLSTGKEGGASKEITWVEFRDMLLMLPRSASVPEIYRFYQVRKRYPDGRGAARVNSDGDLSPSFPTPPPPLQPIKPKPPIPASTTPSSTTSSTLPSSGTSSTPASPPSIEAHHHSMAGGIIRGEDEDEDEDEEDDEWEDGNGISVDIAGKFLAAGGIAGAVSRTATAPFDRLKVFLITDSTLPDASDIKPIVSKTFQGLENLKRATMRLYINGGGLRSFWVGNGLNVIKIMPESAIKFFSYESSKRFLARYWDKVDDPSLISGSSRFLSGGIGGLTSQFAIYPLETLKTQHMTTAGSNHSSKILLKNAVAMWQTGGIRRYYRGLTLGLVGVFPYAAIDMSTFETLKINYCRHFQIDEPETYAVLAFGAISGGVGATSVYPINVLRTKLQASGSTGHPQTYTGFYDVLQKTVSKEGWRGMYKGLTVTLAKVVPAVSISYVVYEHSKRKLGL
ncbi:mitochondrial carrier domain-containing protein [Mrakia frigida]|uniref:mitochondrial carrier domain-containing protein n=1 Tax=Mrakia frigida TaxID=29902 RepID=UPI003FCC2001